jgi:hypothetical protein
MKVLKTPPNTASISENQKILGIHQPHHLRHRILRIGPEKGFNQTRPFDQSQKARQKAGSLRPCKRRFAATHNTGQTFSLMIVPC